MGNGRKKTRFCLLHIPAWCCSKHTCFYCPNRCDLSQWQTDWRMDSLSLYSVVTYLSSKYGSSSFSEFCDSPWFFMLSPHLSSKSPTDHTGTSSMSFPRRTPTGLLGLWRMKYSQDLGAWLGLLPIWKCWWWSPVLTYPYVEVSLSKTFNPKEAWSKTGSPSQVKTRHFSLFVSEMFQISVATF